MIAATALTRVIAHGAGARRGLVTFRAKGAAPITATGMAVRFPRARGPRRYGPRR